MSKLFRKLGVNGNDKIEVAGEEYKQSYCICQDSHFSVSNGIETAKCVYCKKPPYGVIMKFIN